MVPSASEEPAALRLIADPSSPLYGPPASATGGWLGVGGGVGVGVGVGVAAGLTVNVAVAAAAVVGSVSASHAGSVEALDTKTFMVHTPVLAGAKVSSKLPVWQTALSRLSEASYQLR